MEPKGEDEESKKNPGHAGVLEAKLNPGENARDGLLVVGVGLGYRGGGTL